MRPPINWGPGAIYPLPPISVALHVGDVWPRSEGRHIYVARQYQVLHQLTRKGTNMQLDLYRDREDLSVARFLLDFCVFICHFKKRPRRAIIFIMIYTLITLYFKHSWEWNSTNTFLKYVILKGQCTLFLTYLVCDEKGMILANYVNDHYCCMELSSTWNVNKKL